MSGEAARNWGRPAPDPDLGVGAVAWHPWMDGSKHRAKGPSWTGAYAPIEVAQRVEGHNLSLSRVDPALVSGPGQAAESWMAGRGKGVWMPMNQSFQVRATTALSLVALAAAPAASQTVPVEPIPIGAPVRVTLLESDERWIGAVRSWSGSEFSGEGMDRTSATFPFADVVRIERRVDGRRRWIEGALVGGAVGWVLVGLGRWSPCLSSVDGECLHRTRRYLPDGSGAVLVVGGVLAGSGVGLLFRTRRWQEVDGPWSATAPRGAFDIGLAFTELLPR